MMSIAALLDQGQKALSGSDSPQLDAQVLLCDILNIDRSYLYRSPEEIVSDKDQDQYFKHIEQRRQGKPISYLTGKREFWSLEFLVNELTLIPRPETEHLVEVALSIIQKGRIQKIADLGTGSGAIAVSLASEIADRYPDCQIIATDLSADALTIAEQNINKHGLNNITLKEGSWCTALGEAKFDLIVSNPPYIAAGHSCLNAGDVRHEPMIALESGIDGLEAIREIIHNSPRHMNPGAWLVLEHGYDQKDKIQQLLLEKGFLEIKTVQDYAHHDRVTLGRRPADGHK